VVRVCFVELVDCHERDREQTMVAMKEIRALSDRIAHVFDPERIILFGSRAYGKPRRDSDVDLLVILPFRDSGFDMSTEILSQVTPPSVVDVQARRPDETKRRYREWDPMIREAIDRGKVLYERHGSRMARKSASRLRQRALA
jgi:uncharacterized protein